MNLFSGCDDEIQHLLTMRADVCHYCAILDMYAPCIVSYQAWNNDANMSRHCGAADLKSFNQHVLSISDEAFLVLVLINAGARWMAEVKRELGKVRNQWYIIALSLFCIGTNPNVSKTERGLKHRKTPCQ